MATLTNIFEYDAKAEAEFAELTKQIRPLPPEILPSRRFMEQTRMRILGLGDNKRSTQAA